MIIGFLLSIILFNYLRGPSKHSYTGHTPGFPASADRAAAYEELWRREEADLWDWLDQRIGVDPDIYTSTPQPQAQTRQDKIQKTAKGVKQNIMQDVRMTEREMENAIQATEEKLKRLKKTLKAEEKGGGAVVEKEGSKGES